MGQRRAALRSLRRNGIPAGIGALSDFFMSIRLHELYKLAVAGSEEERTQCLDYWLSLPVEERLKSECQIAWERLKDMDKGKQ
jgi:hypothetical protein